MATQIQIRRDSTTNWSTSNPILAQGEFGLDLNVNNIKVGNALSAWNDLPYQFTTGAEFNSYKNSVGSLSGNWNSVYSNINSTSSNYQSVYNNVNSTSANYILHNGNSRGQNLLIGTNDSFDLNFETAGVTRMTINTSGNTTLTNNLSVGGSLYNNEAEFINKLPITSALTTTGTLYIHNGGATGTSITCNSQQLFLVPIWVPTDCTIDQAGIFASTNAGSGVDVKICIYDARFDGRPITRVGGVATVASGTTGGVYVASSFAQTISLKRGNYYAGIMGFGANVNLNRSVPGNISMANGSPILSGIYRTLPGYYDMQGGHLITAISGGNEPPDDLSSRTLDTTTGGGTGITSTFRYRQSAPFVFFRLAI
jgi:hypothetical protein